MLKKLLLSSILVFCLVLPIKVDAELKRQVTVIKGVLVGPLYSNVRGHGVEEMYQDSYSVAGGGDAYCLNPGLLYGPEGSNSTTYCLSRKYDITSCTQGSKKYECGLAQIISENADYLTTLTALRLWAKANGVGGSGKNNAILLALSSRLLHAAAGNPLFYGNGAQAATDLYKDVYENGFQLNMPEIEPKFADYSVESKQSTIYLSTGLDRKIEVTSVQVLNYPFPVVSTDVVECPGEAGKQCIKIQLDMSSYNLTSSVQVQLNVKYKDETGVISKIGYYTQCDHAQRYQDMIIYDPSVDGEVPVEVKIRIEPNICTIVDGVYYDKNGQVTTETGYVISCGVCARVNGICYYNGAEIGCDDPVYLENCDEACPEKPINTLPDRCSDTETTGIVGDPEICGIIRNGDNNYKASYSNNYCSIFCREELEFTFMTKEEAVAGRYFKHNVTSPHDASLNNLSVNIVGKKQCTSLIDFDKWQEDYEDANRSVLSSWDTLKMWEAFYSIEGNGDPSKRDKGGGTTSDCSDCKHEDIDDFYLYWGEVDWNGVTEEGEPVEHIKDSISDTGENAKCPQRDCEKREVTDPISGVTVTEEVNCKCTSPTSTPAEEAELEMVRDGHDDAVDGYYTAITKRENLLRDIQNCNFMSLDPDAIDAGIEEQQYDSRMFNTHFRSMYAEDVNYVVDTSFWAYLLQYDLQNELDILYDENEEFNEGYDISTANELNENYLKVTEKGFSKSEAKSVCSDCEYDLSGEGTDPNLKNYDYWDCNGSLTGAHCDKKSILIPENKTVNMVVERETNHYQETEFYTKKLTGEVVTSGGDDLYNLDNKIYPVSINRAEGDYGIEVKFGHLGDADRSNTMQIKLDPFYCEYHVKPTIPERPGDDPYCPEPPCEDPGDSDKGIKGLYFRTIDLSNVFPNSIYDPNYSSLEATPSKRQIGYNWRISGNVIEEIQNLGNDIWTNKDIKPEYKFVLTPKIISEIRKYNDNITYGDYNLDCSGLNCTSNFLKNELREIMKDDYERYYIRNNNYTNNLYDYHESYPRGEE